MVVLEGANIVIDEFSSARPGAAFFLSHVHQDHYKGLSNSWCAGKIYCTEATRQVMLERFPGLRGRFVALELGETTSVFLGADQDVEFSVRALDAGHCPGSAMFFLCGFFGRVLYTGDFRVEHSQVPRWAAQVLADEQQEGLEAPGLLDCEEPLDLLLLDNTHQGIETPERAELERLLARAMALYPSSTKFRLGMEFGKEELAVRLAAQLDCTVAVRESTFAEYRAMGRADVLGRMVRKPRADTRIFLDSRTSVKERGVNSWNVDGDRVVGVLLMGGLIRGRRTVEFSARSPPTPLFTEEHLAAFERARASRGAAALPNFLTVPYTLHATGSDLSALLARVPHRKVVGFVHRELQSALGRFAVGEDAARKAALERACRDVAPLIYARPRTLPTPPRKRAAARLELAVVVGQKRAKVAPSGIFARLGRRSRRRTLMLDAEAEAAAAVAKDETPPPPAPGLGTSTVGTVRAYPVCVKVEAPPQEDAAPTAASVGSAWGEQWKAAHDKIAIAMASIAKSRSRNAGPYASLCAIAKGFGKSEEECLERFEAVLRPRLVAAKRASRKREQKRQARAAGRLTS